MLQCRQRQATLRHCRHIAAAQPAMQHARDKGVTRADPVNDLGNFRLARLVKIPPPINPCGNTMVAG